MRYVKVLINYAVGQTFQGFLAIKRCEVRQTSTKKDYLDLTLSDGHTDMVARAWEHTGPAPTVNTVIYANAMMTQYRSDNQLNINKWRVSGDGECNPADFLPVTPKDVNQMREELKGYMLRITDPGLVQMLRSIFTFYYNDFIEAPAALYYHEPYIGGLLEHTCGVVDQCLRLATDDIDTDLLLTGAILHDIGKCLDYNWKNSCVITMTDTGQLLGHITQGMMLISGQAVNCPDLTTERLNLLLHLIASHHGKLEYGSPVEPRTKEAILLHNADMLNAELWKINKAQSQTPDGENWTGKVIGMNRRFWVGDNR